MDGYNCWTKHGKEPAKPAEGQGRCERTNLPINYEMEHPDNEIEDISDEKLDPANDVTDGEENDANDGDIGDMPKLRTMLHHFQGDDRLSKE
jgi:hypothetical protein